MFRGWRWRWGGGEGGCLEQVYLGGVSEGCLNVQRVSKRLSKGYVESAQSVCGAHLNSVWRGVSGGVCLDSGLEGVWRGLYLEVGGGVSKDGTYEWCMVCLEGCVWRGML